MRPGRTAPKAASHARPFHPTRPFPLTPSRPPAPPLPIARAEPEPHRGLLRGSRGRLQRLRVADHHHGSSRHHVVRPRSDPPLARGFPRLETSKAPRAVFERTAVRALRRRDARLTSPDPFPSRSEGGFFTANMSFPQDYPNKPPTVRFVSEMWHPNVYADGRVCIPILHSRARPVGSSRRRALEPRADRRDDHAVHHLHAQ